MQQLGRQGSEKLLQDLAVISNGDASRLEVLRRKVAALDMDAPQQRAIESRLKLARFRTLLGRLQRLRKATDNDAKDKLSQLADRVRFAVAEATKMRSEAAQFPTDWHVGSVAWQDLWKVAKSFAESAFFGSSPFFDPATHAECVLCRQVLSEDATKRMVAFASLASPDSRPGSAGVRRPGICHEHAPHDECGIARRYQYFGRGRCGIGGDEEFSGIISCRRA